MKAKGIGILTLSFFLLFSLTLLALEKHNFPKKLKREGYVLQAMRVNASLKIDGFLQEEIWQKAPAATNFLQKQPQEGKPSTEKTEVRVLYNQQNIYRYYVL